MIQTEKNFGIAAMKAGMDEKTARKYRKMGKLPSELKQEHNWRTRKDPFEDVWDGIKGMLSINPGLEAKTIFEDLQRNQPSRFADGQLRTLQRRIKHWRATEGPGKEIFFAQIHKPGELCQSDFTHMDELGITISGVPFDHMIYHFVLTYSNWETGTICFSESFESLSQGLQNALWELGGVPYHHRTDRLAAAVNKETHPEEFTRRYQDLVDHYGLTPSKTNPSSPNENGDVEQRNYRFKKAVEQALLLRGHRDFKDREEYESFLSRLFGQLNAGRKGRLAEEVELLHRLPKRRIDSCKKLDLKVGPSSTIRVNHNVYSVNSRLIGEKIQVRLYMECLEIWYGQKKIDTLPRLRGEGKHKINYRHIIDSLVKKPRAFENYRYRDAMFPTSRFRIAYDYLKERYTVQSAASRYLKILYLAAKDSEVAVDSALTVLINESHEISKDAVQRLMESNAPVAGPDDIHIPAVDLTLYDKLLKEVAA
ncbi:integrase, catalytic region [Desulfobacula toluolica Tol2]|uniref:Integrase n=1 Tax=Desulfobacula toluolica (strain DSM 7467 / Tol2) TaxID=651182 RepID=K0NH19_DESTT|nr:integrase, catalytic region [Desulfobacula toluolica Tol2]CCK79662.1 integrase [Desulfobacula toluolica Tol2]CCK80024.1 integrase catalytic region [Desulfobacula toluolica Tol2]CCK80526.1 integrase [Desulfobacula toluolica Tol2]CCK80790.1 integrase, catalytic region [Desulfobacula toluolica Tol2]